MLRLRSHLVDLVIFLFPIGVRLGCMSSQLPIYLLYYREMDI